MVTNVSANESSHTELATQPSIWIRGLYMLLFVIVARLTEMVIGVVMLVQFILKAATGNTNGNLVGFGDQLSQYLFAIVRFQTFNTEEKPFPFKPWPQVGAASE